MIVKMPTINRENSRQAIDELTNYLAMMNEQLEFNLSHISVDDFDNDTAESIGSMSNKLADMESKIEDMAVMISGLDSRITNAVSSITDIYGILSRHNLF